MYLGIYIIFTYTILPPFSRETRENVTLSGLDPNGNLMTKSINMQMVNTGNHNFFLHCVTNRTDDWNRCGHYATTTLICITCT